MYTTTRNIASGTLMTCNDCGHTISMNKVCEKPLQSATDMRKHIAAHNTFHVFTAVERVIRPEPKGVLSNDLAHMRGIAVPLPG
jgi:hypothetical protein